MAPLAALENRMLDALLAAMQAIGTPSSSWRTAPQAVEEEFPRDALPVPTTPLLYMWHVRTDPRPGDAALTRMAYRAHFVVMIVAGSFRVLLDAKADVLQALYANRNAVAAGLSGTVVSVQPFMPDGYNRRDDMSAAGNAVGEFNLYIDYDTDAATA